MAPDRARPARVATFALMGLAYAACEVAAYPDGRPRPFGVGFGLALFVAAVLASYLLPSGDRPSSRVRLGLTGLLALPVLVEPLLRSFAGEGFPLELQLVNGLRVLGVGLAGAAVYSRLRRLAGVVALFLALFASAMGDQPAIPYLLGAFAAAGGLWLVLEHRAAHSDAADAVAADAVGRAALRLPFREAAVFGLLAVAAGGVAVAGPKRVVLHLGELVPTSGGTGATDPFARYGVGDGPEEVAGENAKSAGMVETDKMIEDTKDALIDAVNDMYGPPHKPPKERERMVAAGKLDIIQNHGKLPENKKPSRDFDTGRKGPKRDGLKPESTAARGLFEVEGRTPLHVRLVAYDSYDAADQRWTEGRKPAALGLVADGGDWMRVDNLRDADWYAADDRHRLKTASLRDNLVPTPSLLTRIRINKVDRPDYYEWDFDGVLALAGRKKTPPGVVVVTDCRTVDPARLPADAFARVGPIGAVPPTAAVPDAVRPTIERQAAEWAGDAAPGWPRVRAVLDRLRADFTLDPTAAAPPDHPAPVLWFLTESKRGPDYLFASSAALLLRTLGHPTRVCLGYYAAPAAYDAETGHTPVKRADLHLWAEVQLKDGHWLPVEATPGYEVLLPIYSWQEQLLDTGRAAVVWARSNVVGLGVAAVVCGLLVWRRRRVFDAIQTFAWATWPGRSDREVVLRAVKVLDRRGRLAGRARPPSQTLASWAGSLGEPAAELATLADWAAYAPGLPPPAADVRAVCRRALAACPLTKLTAGGPPA